MNFAIIQSGLVVNIAVADPGFAAAQGWIELPANAGIGWRYEGGTFLPPPPASDPEPVHDYLAFWDALIASTVYASIRTQSMTSLPMNTLATEFIALISDAKAGRPNVTAIQSSISAIFAAGTFSTGEISEFQLALGVGNIGETYSLPIS